MGVLLRLSLVSLAALSLAGLALADDAPPGSYQSTCRDIDYDWDTLTATCRNRYGQWNESILQNYNDCDGDIANDDGRLRCRNSDSQDDQDDRWDDSSTRAPQGSYRRTCRNEDVDRRTLTAECQDRNGRYRYSELEDYRSCRGDIRNNNGVLQCDREDDDYESGDNLPGGLWRSTCRDYHMYGRVLYAKCKDAYGRYLETSIDLRNCTSQIINDRGRLVCGSSGGYGRIILYKHINFGGKSRTYSTDIPDLNVAAFGNIASSVVVQGGVWQLCDRPNYKGYCVVIDRTQSNLVKLGFNDRAESVRRVR